MLPVLCVIGRPGAPVSKVIEGLVRELSEEGARVAVVVERETPLPERSLPAETEGYTKAGSGLLMVKAPNALLSLRRTEREPALDELVWEMRDEYDLVIAEGFRHSSFLKLEVHRSEDGDQLICHKNELLAVAGDKPEGTDLPVYPLEEIASLADLVRRRFLTSEPGEDAAVFIDGVRLPLALFVRKMLAGTVLGMVRTLKGVEEPRSVVVSVRTRR